MHNTDLERFYKRHRDWLARLGILDRPWLILGSAPDPALPSEMIATHARIDINNAGRTAAERGLGPADLTVRAQRKSWKEHPDLTTRGLLWFHMAPPPFVYLRLVLKRRQARVGSLLVAPPQQREAVVDHVCGAAMGGGGNLRKATNGVAAACYALFLGVPEVVLVGISLSKDGHSYNDAHRQRLQIDEDRFVFERIRNDPRLSTTEPDLAEAAGIPLRGG